MGYYSQVGYIVQGKKEEMVPILTTFRLTYPESKYAQEALNECAYSLHDGWLTVRFQNDNCKWYEGYDNVDNHISLFAAFSEAAEKEGSSINGGFVLVGEDDDDIKTQYFGSDPYDLLHPVRSIEFEVEADGTLESVLRAT